MKQEFGEDGQVFSAQPCMVEESDAFVGKAPTDESGTSVVSSSRAAASMMGKNVKTPFGQGIVLEYRAENETFVIKLTSEHTFSTLAMLYTKTVPERYETPSEKADALNVAYEALEKMRRMNLEVMCHEIGIHEDIDHEYCTTCLLINNGSGKSHFPRLQKLVDQAVASDLEKFPRLSRLFHSSSNDSKDDTTPINTNGDAQRPLSTTDSTNEKRSAEQESVGGKSTTVAEEVPALSQPIRQQASSTDQEPEADSPSATQEQLLQQTMTTKTSPNGGKTSFPRLRNVWGAIKSIPQPVVQYTPSNPAPVLPVSSSSQQQIDGKSKPSNFPRIRGLLESSGASDIFNSISNTTLVASSKAETKTTKTSSTDLTRRGGVFETSAASTIFGSMTISKHPSKPSPTKAATSEKPKALPRIQRLIDQRHIANTSPCLICASPSCSSHSSASFRKEGITLCLQCEKLFELDFIVDCISTPDPAERAKNIDHMVDCYDRCMLLLEYSSQFVEHIASSLEEQKKRQNKVGLASSSVGVLSGVLGLAAAASILTPVGPPLLIASLFFGGGATTVQTGSEVINYFSEPRKLADRIIALHGMALSLLRVTSTLRDALLRDHIRTDVYAAEPAPLKEQVQEKLEKNRVVVLAGSNVGRSVALGGVAGAEAAGAGAVAAGAATEMGAASAVAGAGAASARGATAISRASTAAARTVRFARFAGGALSAAVLVLEANAVQSTLKSIRDGSPCDKADLLRRAVQEVKDFPTSTQLDDECQAYLKALASRPPPPQVVEVAAMPDNLPDDTIVPEATCQAVTGEHQLCAPGASILLGQASYSQVNTPDARTSLHSMSSSFLSSPSLLQRFHERQERRQNVAMAQTEEVVAVAVDDAQLSASSARMNLLL